MSAATSKIDPTEATAANQNADVGPTANELMMESAANELVVAVVGHVGSGTSKVADALSALLSSASLPGGPYDTILLKARAEIDLWAQSVNEPLPTSERKDLQTTFRYQELGDLMRVRSKDGSAVARALVKTIRQTRAAKTGKQIAAGEAVVPDGKRRAYILDAIRNPAEVELLRHLYQDAFVLIGVVCDERTRLARRNVSTTLIQLFV